MSVTVGQLIILKTSVRLKNKSNSVTPNIAMNIASKIFILPFIFNHVGFLIHFLDDANPSPHKNIEPYSQVVYSGIV